MYRAISQHTKSIGLNQPIYVQQCDDQFKIIRFQIDDTGNVVKRLEGFTKNIPPGTIPFNPIEYITAKSELYRRVNLIE